VSGPDRRHAVNKGGVREVLGRWEDQATE
jgi:hypothetical protein